MPSLSRRRPASWSQTASEECTEPVTMSSGMPNCGAKKRECAPDDGSTVSGETRQNARSPSAVPISPRRPRAGRSAWRVARSATGSKRSVSGVTAGRAHRPSRDSARPSAARMSARGPSKAAQTGSGGSSQSTEPSARASIATGSTPCVVAKTTRSPDSSPRVQEGAHGAERRVARVGDLARRRELAQAMVGVGPGRGRDEGRARRLHLAGDRLHLGLAQPVGVEHGGRGIAGEGTIREHVDARDRHRAAHRRMRSRRRRAWRSRARVDQMVADDRAMRR